MFFIKLSKKIITEAGAIDVLDDKGDDLASSSGFQETIKGTDQMVRNGLESYHTILPATSKLSRMKIESVSCIILCLLHLHR